VRNYLESRLVRTGLVIVGVGCGPLLLIILAAAVGLWPDPNPNPVGPGLLAALSFWPGVGCLGVGFVRVWLGRSD
jgi:hypothetical protein